MTGIKTMLCSLEEGGGPHVSNLSLLSPIYKAVLKRMENFHVVTVTDEGNQKALYGRRALKWLYESVAIKDEQGITVHPVELKALRTYSWILTDGERKTANKWIHLSSAKAAAASSKILFGGSLTDIAGGAIVEVPTASLPAIKGLEEDMAMVPICTASASSSSAALPTATPAKSKSGPAASKKETSKPPVSVDGPKQSVLSKFLKPSGCR
jgi:hypothetical protein